MQINVFSPLITGISVRKNAHPAINNRQILFYLHLYVCSDDQMLQLKDDTS
jgi:hypothetical protein